MPQKHLEIAIEFETKHGVAQMCVHTFGGDGGSHDDDGDGDDGDGDDDDDRMLGSVIRHVVVPCRLDVRPL